MADENALVLMTAKQLASALMTAVAAMQGLTNKQLQDRSIDFSKLHFHDRSQAEIAWNDVQAIMAFNELMGQKLTVPLTATEGYNQHGHTSDYDGGYIGVQVHDHRDNFNGGLSFAIYHPGCALPQQHWAI